MRVLYLIANCFYFFPFWWHGSFPFHALRLPVFFLCGQIHTLWFTQCRNVDLSKWRTLVIRSVWIRIVTKWVIRVGVWVTSFWRCFVLWLSSSITFLRLSFLNRSKHVWWATETTHHITYVVVSMFIISLTWLWVGVCLISLRNMKENTEISVVERLQIEVRLLNWAQIKK